MLHLCLILKAAHFCSNPLYFCSLPAVLDLMETCIDDVLRQAQAAPAVSAVDEAGASSSFSADDPLSLAGERLTRGTINMSEWSWEGLTP